MSSEHFLGDLAALEFECSVSAAELHREVTRVLDVGRNQYDRPDKLKDALLVTSTGPVETELWFRETDWSVDIDGYKATIVVAKGVDPTSKQVVAPAKSRRFGILRKSVEPPKIEAKQEVLPQMMAVKLGDRVILPFATFRKNTGDENCSYVQVGTEMNGESLHIVASDDEKQTSRKVVVESMRGFGYKGDYGRTKTPTPDAIPEQIHKEVARHAEPLYEALQAQLVGSFSERFSLAQDTDLFTEAVPSGHAYDSTKLYGLVGVPIRLNDSMQGVLAVTKDINSGEQALGVITRGKLFVPLLKIWETQGVTEVVHRGQLSINEMLRIGELLESKHAKKGELAESSYYDKARNAGIEPLFLHLVVAHEIQRKINYSDGSKKWITGRALLEEFIKNYSSNRPSTALDHMTTFNTADNLRGLSSNEDQNVRKGVATDILKLAKKLYDDSGEVYDLLMAKTESFPFASRQDTARERLTEKIATMSSQESYSGVLQKIKIGSVVGDLALRAHVTVMDGNYTLHMQGKPAALDTAGYSKLYTETISLLQGTQISDQRVTQLLATLRSLKPRTK